MFLRTVLQVGAVVALLVLVATVSMVDTGRLARTRAEYRTRIRAVVPIAAVLGGALLFNGVAREGVPEVSWMVGVNLTPALYELEGQLIVWIQAFATPALTSFFAFVYVYGYVFVLVFPVIVYFFFEDTRPLQETLTAYSFNYVLGLLCYVLFIAYGPRNVMPELVEALMYDAWPRYQHLTRQVNRSTNVFPSLHTSLAVTVALLAYRTREDVPAWFVLSTGLALSIAFSTMYLGIHWASDVLAGVLLAVVSVHLARRVIDRLEPSTS